MNKAQALAMISALEGASMPASVALTFPAGKESWQVLLDPTVVYSGQQLLEISSYCQSNNLTLSAQFSAIGVV